MQADRAGRDSDLLRTLFALHDFYVFYETYKYPIPEASHLISVQSRTEIIVKNNTYALRFDV